MELGISPYTSRTHSPSTKTGVNRCFRRSPKPHRKSLEQSYYRIGARYYDADLGMWVSVDPMREFADPYAYMGNDWNPIIGVDPDGNNPATYLTVALVNTPVAVYNLYKARNASIEQGDKSSVANAKGAGAFFGTYLFAAIIKSPILNGVVSGAALDVFNQKMEGKGKIDWMKVSDEASKGGLVGASSALGESIALKYLYAEGAALLGATAGSVAGNELLEETTRDQKNDIPTKDD